MPPFFVMFLSCLKMQCIFELFLLDDLEGVIEYS